jgi:hypothetical protein
VLLHVVKKHDEHTSVVFASGQLEKQESRFQKLNARFSLCQWKTCVVG